MTNQHSKLQKPKISVALATYNEEDNIVSCLEAVKGLASEIIVVDGSSTDETVAIAKKHGARVFVTTNKPIFHINKQIAIDKCKGDWILQLDADEQVSPELRDEILSFFSTQPVAFYVPRKNYFIGRWMRKGGQYPDYVIRFFKKGKAVLPCKSVHEQMEVKGEIGYLKGHLLHRGVPTFSRYLNHANRYTSLTAQKMMDDKQAINVFSLFDYCLTRPAKTFFSLYIRHKGFIDGWRGFVFAFFSGAHHAVAYRKYCQWKKQKRNIDLKKDWS